MKSRLDEAIVTVLADNGHGMRAEQIAQEINARQLHCRRDGKPVTDKQIYAVTLRYRQVFAFEHGLIYLLM